MSQFEHLGVRSEIVQAVEDMEWLLPTDVQDEAIPLILGGGDVMIAAETGSGKTGAFAIPIIQQIYETLRGEAVMAGADDDEATQTAPRPSSVRWDQFDRELTFAIDPGGYRVQARNDKAWEGCRANLGLIKGKHYYEGTLLDEGISRLGWSVHGASFNIGTDGKSFGYGGTAMKSHSSFEAYGEKYIKGDTIGCYLDLDGGVVSYSKNGKFLGEAFKIPQHLKGLPLYPAVVVKNAEMDFNFGQETWKFPPMQGYTGVANAKIEDTHQQPKQAGAAKHKPKKNSKSPLALIVEPTQELANQVHEEIKKFQAYLTDPPLSHVLVTGAGNFGETKRQLSQGVHLVVGTIGSLKGVMKSGQLDLSGTTFFVLDEADQLLDQGNKGDIMDMYERLPTKDPGMQIVVCSATLHTPGIRELTDTICKRPQWVDLKGKDSVPELVDHMVVEVDPTKDQSWKQDLRDVPHDMVHDNQDANKGNADALSLGVKILKVKVLLEVIQSFKIDQAIIFCRTRVDCDNVAAYLTKQGGGRGFGGKAESGKENPYSCTILHGGKGPERQVALDAFKEGDVRFIICTDVAARGIDVKELPFVINMTLPEPSEQYIHRVGRVGRAGCQGLAISLWSPVKEKVWWHTCASKGRGNECRKRHLVDQGGCCKWFDEPALLAEIETRLSVGREVKLQIPKLGRANMTKGREAAAKGRPPPEGSKMLSETMQHVDVLKPMVRELCQLEISAQQNYLRFSNRAVWGTAGPAAGGKRLKK